VDVHTFTVAALQTLLTRRLRCERVNIDYESGLGIAAPSSPPLLPKVAIALPLLPFSLVPLAQLPVPLGIKHREDPCQKSSSAVEHDTYTQRDQPASLITVFDTQRKMLVNIGIYPIPGHRGAKLSLHLDSRRHGHRHPSHVMWSLV
jgi:hypothetical protein